MAEQSDIVEDKMRTIKSVSSLSVVVKESFFEWLSDGNAKSYSPAVYLACIDKVSVYLIRRKISTLDLWQITNFGLFKSVYDKAINDNLFRAIDKKTYTVFVQVGKAFLKFLKTKPAIHKVPVIDLVSPNQPVSRLTIKEAIIRVLEAESHGMTVEQIYSRIIADKLYSFGAQNPQNVVRVEIDRACEDSNYTVRASMNRFRFERNHKGEKVYFLLSSALTDDIAQSSIIVGDESPKTEQAKVLARLVSNDMPIHVKKASPIPIANSELDDIIDLEEGKNGIREILNTHFLALYGYSNVGILWSAAQNSLSMFLNDNAINSVDDFGRFLVRAFKNEFVFSLPHLWKNEPDYPRSSRGLIINLARQHGGVVTRTQIDDFFSRIKLTSLYNSFVLDKGQLLFCDKEKFILTATVNPSTERCSLIAKALNTLFSYENTHFIVLRDISSSWFSRLPELPNGLQWTPLLLQELLRICPELGYRIISPDLRGQALDTVGAAIVPSKSEIETFADIVHRFSYRKYKLPFKLSAEELRLDLREAGMLDGNELIYNMHKALKDYRFAFSDENRTVMILER